MTCDFTFVNHCRPLPEKFIYSWKEFCWWGTSFSRAFERLEGVAWVPKSCGALASFLSLSPSLCSLLLHLDAGFCFCPPLWSVSPPLNKEPLIIPYWSQCGITSSCMFPFIWNVPLHSVWVPNQTIITDHTQNLPNSFLIKTVTFCVKYG